MNFTKSLFLAPVLALSMAVPVVAGSPDHAGERGDLVETSREAWQSTNGPSGWGQRVSSKANGTVSNPDGNLGNFLGRMADGPSSSDNRGPKK